MVYQLGIPPLDREINGVDEGTNLLIKGPAMSGKTTFIKRVVTQAIQGNEGVIYVTTNHTGTDILSDYNEEEIQKSRFGVVDCVSQNQGLGDSEETEVIKLASSPNDMTGIGIKVSELLEDYWETNNVEKNRVILNSVSTLLMYSELQTVFRFLHVFTGRIRSVNGLGVLTVDSKMHSDREYSTLQQLFDGVIEIKKEKNNETARVSGIGDNGTGWIEIE